MNLILFLCVLALVVVSSFFSGAETSMMALNRYRLRHLAKKSHAARRAEALLKRPDRLLAVILIGNTFANILASALATILAQRLFGDFGVAMSTVVLTVFILLFSEVLPKTIAALQPERLAFPATLILKILQSLMYPFIYLLSAVTNAILRVFGIHVSDKKAMDPLTSDELRSVLLASGKSLTGEHKNMLLGVLDLERATVLDAMLPRQNIKGIDLNDSWQSIFKQLKTSPYSKLPVYRDNIDHVVGILHVRHVIGLDLKTAPREILQKVLVEPYFIPETTSLQQQLVNFQQRSEHMGLVVDEYGDIQGLVTVEDILEEIVGEFNNLSQPSVHTETQKLEDGSFIVNGSMTIRDLNRNLDTRFSTHGPKTLSGLITEYLEAMPVAHIAVKIKDYPIEILEVDDNAVKKARLYPRLPRMED